MWIGGRYAQWFICFLSCSVPYELYALLLYLFTDDNQICSLEITIIYIKEEEEEVKEEDVRRGTVEAKTTKK